MLIGRLAAVVALAAQVSCRWAPASDSATAAEAASARVERVSVAARPSLVLLARDGDPRPAVALAFAHDFGSQASVALAALLAERLARRDFRDVVIDAHALGAGLSTLVRDSDEAARFFREASVTMQSPVRSDDPVLGRVSTRVQTLRARVWGGAAEQNVALCSGELGVTTRATLPDFRVGSWASTLERWRKRVASTGAVRFAVVGPATLVARAGGAVRDLPAWPEGAEPDDPWPQADYVGVDSNSASAKRLALALRLNDTPRALAAAHELTQASSPLRVRLGALAPEWKLDRVAAISRPRGACLRLDFAGPSSEDPGWAEAARVVALGQDEMDNVLASVRGERTDADESLVRPADPRRAASAAAWRALADLQPAGPNRRAVAFSTRFAGPSAEADRHLRAALRREAQAHRATELELRVRAEAGQAEVWALLASPCLAGAAKRTATASPAVFVTAAAMAQPSFGTVAVEPWVSPVGIGVIAHGPRAFPGEAPRLHARRVAAALGRALLRASMPGNHALLSARSELMDEIGSTPRPGWWRTLDTLTNGQVGWLEPRGSWDALRDATLEGAKEQWTLFLSGPLRLAVVANGDPEQGNELRSALDRWLRPMLARRWACPAPPARVTISSEQRLVLGSEALAYIAARVPAGQYEHARWTAWLLNRPTGWLERSLEQPGLVSSASAQVAGRPDFAALIVEVRALDARLDRAVAQVRALLDRLASGAATQKDFADAHDAFAAARSNGALEPRNRLVQLWSGPEPPSVAGLRALRAFHGALRPDRLTVVVVEPAR